MDSFIYNTRVQVPNDIRNMSTHDDSVFLKPSGGITDDGVGTCGGLLQKTQKNTKKYIYQKKGQLTSCQKAMMVGTLDVRTVRLAHKQLELSRVFSDSRLKILGIQEHRIVHTDTTVIDNIMGTY